MYREWFNLYVHHVDKHNKAMDTTRIPKYLSALLSFTILPEKTNHCLHHP